MKRFMFVLALIGLILIGCEADLDDDADFSRPVGESLVMTLNRAYTTEGGQFGEAPSGQTYLVLELTIANDDERSRSITSMLMFELLGDVGGTYTYDGFALSETDLQGLDRTLSPGESHTGYLPFIIDAADSQWELSFTPDIYTGPSFTVTFDETDLD